MAQLKDTTITGGLSVSGTTNLTSGGQSNANITLYAASGDSPALIFQRGTTSDTLNDYKIYDTSGYLKIKQSGNSGTTGYTQVAELTNAGKLTVSTPPATDTTPSISAWISPTDSGIKVSGTAATTTSGDYLLISDTSASGLVVKGPAFGSSTTTYLRNDGTWETPSGGGGGSTEDGVVKFVNRTSLHTVLNSTSNDTRFYGSFDPRSYATQGYYTVSLSISADDVSSDTTYSINRYLVYDVIFLEYGSKYINNSYIYGYAPVDFDWFCSELSYNSSTAKYEATLYIFINSSLSSSKKSVYFTPIVKPAYYITM